MLPKYWPARNTKLRIALNGPQFDMIRRIFAILFLFLPIFLLAEDVKVGPKEETNE